MPSSPIDAVALVPRIAQLSNALNRGRLVEEALRTAQVSVDRPAFSVLLPLHLAGRPLRIKEIADRMQVVQPHVTRQVQQLERSGLVRRTGDPLDKRASLIEPTEEGSAAARRYAETLVGWFTGAIAHWSEQDRADLGRLLSRFADDVTDRLTAMADERDGGGADRNGAAGGASFGSCRTSGGCQDPNGAR